MSLFRVVSHPPERAGQMADTRFVRLRFSWLAALFPAFWALFHGLWQAVVGIAVVIAALVLAEPFIGGAAVGWLYVLFSLWFGFEAQHVRANALVRKGFADQGMLVAPGIDVAEHDWLDKKVTS